MYLNQANRKESLPKADGQLKNVKNKQTNKDKDKFSTIGNTGSPHLTITIKPRISTASHDLSPFYHCF